MVNLPVLEIDGARFDDLEGLWDEVSRRLIPGAYWGRNLDAFNDILRGGFGTPDGGFILRWRNADRSRRVLGHGAMAGWLERKLERGHPSHHERVTQELAAARRGEGPTLFDLLLEIIGEHGEGGAESEDNVVLELLASDHDSDHDSDHVGDTTDS